MQHATVFRENNSWKSHFLATLALGIPLIGAQLAQLGIHATDVVILGRLGAAHLAAIVLAGQFFFTLFIFGSGFAAAVIPMAAQAHGRGDAVSVRRSVRMGMWVVLFYSLAVVPIFLVAEKILLLAGQKPEVAALAHAYLQIAHWGMAPALLFMVLRGLVSAHGRAGIILYLTLVVLVVNAFLAYGLVLGHFGLPALGMEGAALASLIVNCLSFLLMVAYVRARPELRGYQLFHRFWRADWPALREVVHLGLPISLTILAEVSLFTVASLLMGIIGTIELAAHGIALQLSSIAFMLPFGLAQAATVRVGVAHGRGDRVALVRAAWAALVLATGVAAMGGVLFAVMPETLAGVYLDRSDKDSAAVLAYAVPLVIIAGIFQLVDGLQVVAAGLLRGLKDTRIPMVLALISYWPIGFACASLLAFPVGLGGIGVWYGFLSGLVAAAVLLNWRFFRLMAREVAVPRVLLETQHAPVP
ncbi:MATE family efflux transporter [Sinorhizobium sp. BG8]|uniref:MATE family efflux transporter n=1 Tax=Sinorhizobium sp. BG8 TaxID=2613773 RepID=UPI00193CC9FC|nr:MATE family efflux transporter [Sinorhizobium sp. BG8]QRM56230.1 MATE family efflux transporter [Sinorhizobium sp. BG8]